MDQHPNTPSGKKITHRLTFRLVYFSALVGVGIGVLLALVQVYSDFRREQSSTEIAINQLMSSVATAAAEAAFHIDKSRGDAVISGMFVFPAVYRAEISDNFGEILAQKTMSAPTDEANFVARMLFGSEPSRELILVTPNYPETVGRMKVWLDLNLLAEDFSSRVLLILVSGLVRNALLAGALGVLFYFVLARPLVAAANQIQKNENAGDDDAAVIVPKLHRYDEIGVLIESVNTRTYELQQRIRETDALYALSDILGDMDLALGNGLEKAAAAILYAWQLPENICCRITYEGQQYSTRNFVETNWLQFSEIEVGNEIKGRIEVFYLEEGAELAKGHYSANKRPFIDQFAQRLGGWIQYKQTETRLLQSLKMEAVGQLTGGIAHDFNNILAVILGNAELLGTSESTQSSMASAIIRASERGAELTQRLLAFSRQQPLNPKVFDLCQLTVGMRDLLKRTLGEAIDITTLTHDKLWHVLADLGQVENALLNLAINARDAMPKGGKLTIECTNVTLKDGDMKQIPSIEAGEYVVLSVTDQGIGMPESIRKRAFEPFFTTKEVGKGSGLGLSMVYGFAQQSGGQATIYSEEGKGTTVKLYLPRSISEQNAQTVLQPDAVPRGHGQTILVIEDDPEVRELSEMMLRSLGYKVVSAENVSIARHAIEMHSEIRLILSDVVLPGGTSGPEYAEELRIAKPELKVIFMSGYPAEAAKRNGFIGSDNVLLNKPFRITELAKAMNEAME